MVIVNTPSISLEFRCHSYEENSNFELIGLFGLLFYK
jgi:hypothetical protein